MSIFRPIHLSRQQRYRAGGLAFLIILSVSACASRPVPLNSEMIEASFGSYGVDVLKQTGRVRVSNLYSLTDGRKVTRTLAVVQFPEAVAHALKPAHARIISGDSLGATLVRSGWQVRKFTLGFESLAAGPFLASQMGVAPGATLGVHFYQLAAAGQGQELPYVSIAEVHHPAHLTMDTLSKLYGPAPTSTTISTTESNSGVQQQLSQWLKRELTLLNGSGAAVVIDNRYQAQADANHPDHVNGADNALVRTQPAAVHQQD